MKYQKILIATMILFSCAWTQNPQVNQKDIPKIGLVLSGGGALGFAHIGILQIIDSLNIPIDYIAGTSMGGIAGGLYALGHSGNEIEKIVQSIDWTAIFTDMPERDLRSYFQKKDDGKFQFTFGYSKGDINVPSGLIYGQKITMLLANLTNQFEQIENFDELPIPYRCIAVDLITGNEVILKSGSIAKAIRSTMSIPSAFNPVAWGDSLLIDGGLLNNLPVDVVKDMGADIVIAVNVSQSDRSTENLNSALKILDRTIAIPAVLRSEENKKSVDVYIEPELSNYSRTDFFRAKERDGIVQQGKIAAQNAIPDLLKLIADNNLEIKNKSIYDDKYVRKIYIGGNQKMSSDSISKLLNMDIVTRFNIDTLNARISSMKSINYFKTIDYTLLPIEKNKIDILLHITENIEPTIHRISIRGNNTIPFSFIYRLLGISPTDTLDIDIVNKRIDELYGLGYFETISYEIEPIDDDTIHLIFVIKEASRNLLRLGFHYDENYKFIGSAKFLSTKALIPGLRFESTLRFSGLFDFRAKLFYPFRLGGLSIYPYAQTYHKNIPINIYGALGNKIAQYNDKSTSWSAGLGFLSVNNWATEVEYNVEYIDTKPNVAIPDTSLFPTWKHELRKVNFSTNYDKLDDVLIPNKGVLIRANLEAGLKMLNSDVSYRRYELNIDYYKTFFNNHTIRLFTQYGYSQDNLPVYKWFYYGGPNRFVGIEKDELGYYRSSILGIDYRLKLTENLYIKTMYNIAPNYNRKFYPVDVSMFDGYGIGIKYMTYLGPVELIYSRGDKIVEDPNGDQQTVIYLNIGYNL